LVREEMEILKLLLSSQNDIWICTFSFWQDQWYFNSNITNTIHFILKSREV
jgi:hypothetical protein